MHPPLSRIARIAAAAAISVGVAAATAVVTPLAASAAPIGPSSSTRISTGTTVKQTPVVRIAPNAGSHRAGGYVQDGGTLSARGRLPSDLRSAAATLPTSVDLRQFAPTPGDQGQIGSCVAWTIAYGIMGYYANRTGGTGAPYAPLYLYMRVVAPGVPPNAGLYPSKALTEAKTNGVDTLADYVQGNYNYSVLPTTAQVANAKKYTLSGYTSLFVGSQQGAAGSLAIKQALAAGTPVAIGIPVFADFFSMPPNSLYNTISGTSYGGHMIAVLGYDSQGVWIRNSWGRNWGTSGDAKLSWAFIEAQASSAYAVTGIVTPSAQVSTAPSVTGLSVRTGATSGGTPVTISGSNLAGASSVTFGGTPTPFTVNGSGTTRTITTTAPAHSAGTVNVVVSTPAGVSATNSTTTFTYTVPPPVADTVSPSTVLSVGGEAVTLKGRNLTGTTIVTVGSARATSIRVVDDSTIKFVTPAVPAGTAAVRVSTPYGTSAAGTPTLTVVRPPTPTVSSVTPNNGSTLAAKQVTVTGTNLGDTTLVTVGGVPSSFTKLSATSLRVTVRPHAAGTGQVLVTNRGGTSVAVSAGTYTWVTPPPPVVKSVSPRVGVARTTATVRLVVANLGGVRQVLVNGRSVPFKVTSASTLSAVVPALNRSTARITVVAAGGASKPSTATTYTYR